MANKNFFNKNTRKGIATVASNFQIRLGHITRVAIVASVMMLMAVMPAAGQVKLGIKGGITTTELKDKNSLLDKNKHTAYTGGLLLDMNIPKVGLGLEVSALYRYSRDHVLESKKQSPKRHYIDIPVYARYRLSIPGVEKYVAPLVFTGPNISVLVKDDSEVKAENIQKTKVSWDVGAGVDLFKHMRLTVSYGIGMKKAMHVIGKEYNGKTIEGKDHCWTVSAAVMF